MAPKMMSMTPHNEVYVKPLRKTFMGDSNRTSEYATMYSDSSDAASIYENNDRYSTAMDYKNRNTCYPLLIRTGSDDFQALLDLPTPDEYFKDNSPPESPLPYIHPLFRSDSNESDDTASHSDDSEDDSSIRTPPSPFQMDQIDLSCSLFGTAPRRNVARPNPLTVSPRMNHSSYSSSEASTDVSSGFDREAEESNDDSTATSPTDIDASSVLLGTSAHYGRPLQWEGESTPAVVPNTQHASHYFRDKKYDLFPELAPQPAPKSAGRDSPGKEGRLNVTAKQPKWYSMNAGRTANARESLKGYVNRISSYVEERREVEKDEKPQRRMTEELHTHTEVPRVVSRRFTGPMGPLNANPQHPIAEEDEEDTQELDEFHAQLLTSTTSSTSSIYSHGSSRDKAPLSPPPTAKKHGSMHWQLPTKSAMRTKKSVSVMDSRPEPPSRTSSSQSSDKKHISVSWKLPAKNMIRGSQSSYKISSPMGPQVRASAPPRMAPVYSKTPRPSQPTYSKTPRPQSTKPQPRPQPCPTKRATLPSLPQLQTTSNPVKGVFNGAKKRLTTDDAAEKRREEIRARIKFVGSVNPHLCKPQKDPWSPC